LLTSIFKARQYTECAPAEECVSQDEDADLFRKAMRDVRPLRAAERAAPARRAPAPRARFAVAERAAVLAESLAQPGPFIETQAGDELQFRRPGIAATLLRRLRRGEFRVEDELDLHGLTAAQAAAELARFLQQALAHDRRCVRIIHGKGMRSGPRGPVLKQTVNTLLRRADPVLAFSSAQARGGGTGATLVLLGRLSRR
jgi:DNA-nicking Smr family endonuclease